MRVSSRGAAIAACLMAPFATAVPAEAPTPSPTSPPKAPITHEKLWLMKRVGSPAVSPDGKWGLYTLSVPDWKAAKRFTDIYLVSLERGVVKRR